MILTDADHPKFLRIAYEYAQRSNDLSTQNGAVLAHPMTGNIMACGWNDIPEEVEDLPDRRERPAKYAWTEHAERAAIFHAASLGIATKNLWLYCPWLACADCGRAIVCSGVRRVIRHRIPQHDERPDWKASIEAADQMFREAGVSVFEYVGKLGVSFRFCGKVIEV